MKCLVFLIFISISCASFTKKPKCNILSNPLLMDCSNMDLKAIPDHLESVANHTNIKKLILTNNKLNSSVTFKNWDTLWSLDVSHNNISEISPYTFGPLTHLKMLNLSYNNISQIAENTFDELTVLEILDLSGNPLLSNNIDMLQKSLNGLMFRSLKKLMITSSNLTQLPMDIFQSAHELLYLDLSYNNIQKLPILPGGLVYFKANNNSIKTIGIVPFEKTDFLEELFIENNTALTDIDVDAFERLYNLRNLSLKGSSNLTHLPAHLFYFNKKLRHLSLANCNFKSLPHTFKTAFSHVPYLELQNNPWVCNFTNRWFATLTVADNENFRCKVPGNITIKDFYQINSRRGILQYLLVCLLLLVFFLFGLAIYLSFAVEKEKNKMENKYSRLQTERSFVNKVYVSTTV